MFVLTRLKFKGVMLVLVFFSLILIHNRSMGVSDINLPVPLEQVKTDQKVIALTINVDWGEEYIPKILETLDEYNVRVTFFVTGRWVQKNPEVLKAIAARGHLIENHGYSHPHPDQLSVARNKEEISRTEKIIQELTGKKTVFYAPPYGERGKSGLLAAEELGYTTILWTLDTIDWMPESTPDLITQRVIEPKMRYGVQPDKKGAIVLMHPKENTVKALPAILASLRKEQFTLVTLEKLITFKRSGNTTP